MEVLGSNPIPCHWMDLCLVVPDSTPPRFVNSQLVSLPLAGILNKFLFNLQYLFAYMALGIFTSCVVYWRARRANENTNNE